MCPRSVSRAESNTTGIDIWRAEGEDYYAAANANAAVADDDGHSRRVRPPHNRLDPIDEGRQRRGGGSAEGFYDDRRGNHSTKRI